MKQVVLQHLSKPSYDSNNSFVFLVGVIAHLFMVPTFRSGILAASAEPGTILGELARVFAHLAESPCVFADTADLHSTLRGF